MDEEMFHGTLESVISIYTCVCGNNKTTKKMVLASAVYTIFVEICYKC